MGYEIDFLPVGDSNGDAICIRYGSAEVGFSIHVIDGGYRDTGPAIIEHINTHFGAPAYIDHVVLTHADNDHVAGLISVLERFEVGALWMNRPWRFAAETINSFHGNFTVAGLEQAMRDAYPLLVELEEAAEAQGTPVFDVFAHTQIGPFLVLAPTRERYLRLIPDFNRTPPSYGRPMKGFLGQLIERAKDRLLNYFETWDVELLQDNPPAQSASNESCVVQIGVFGDRTALLTADVGPIGLGEAADVAARHGLLRPPAFVQVPHHGSRRNVTPTILNRWLGARIPQGGEDRGIAFCSVGKNKPEYPRKRVKNAFVRRGYPVHSTRTVWKSHYFEMPPKYGMVESVAEPFEYVYEE
jgi:hypothetical protein